MMPLVSLPVRALATFAIVTGLHSVAFGLGADHVSGALPVSSQWTQGMHAALDQPCRVHGFWINSTDILFYEGSPANLRSMLEDFRREVGKDIEVVIHPGRGVARSPWSTHDVGGADWSVTISGNWQARLDVSANVAPPSAPESTPSAVPQSEHADSTQPEATKLLAPEIEAIRNAWNRRAVVVDVWLGGNLSLKTLDVPEGIEIRSSGEIEEFIRRRNQRH